MRPGDGTHAVYRLPTDRRGIINVGPMRLTVTNPFGLAQITTTGDREVSLIVYPRIDDLRSVRRSSGSGVERHQLLQHQVAPLGDEFYPLRQSNVVDDLRRVHWPSSAPQDDLMVRQDEIPWHGHLTVLLDTRQGADPAVFEEAVSAAASIAHGDQVRLVTTAGQETPFAAGPSLIELGHDTTTAMCAPEPAGLEDVIGAQERHDEIVAEVYRQIAPVTRIKAILDPRPHVSE